jgi:enterochelin esterase-like enzyme
LLLLDGQNLFAAAQTDSRLHWDAESKLAAWERPLLVVGVPASKRRYPEYIGWSQEPGHYSPSGDKHAAFLVNFVVPYLKACFPRAKLKGLVGASAGGVAALYTGWCYPKMFPAVGCLSAGRHYFSELLNNFSGVPAPKIYLSCGDRGMDRDFLIESKLFASALKARRQAEVLCRWHKGDHSEPVWSRRIPDILRFTLESSS